MKQGNLNFLFIRVDWYPQIKIQTVYWRFTHKRLFTTYYWRVHYRYKYSDIRAIYSRRNGRQVVAAAKLLVPDPVIVFLHYNYDFHLLGILLTSVNLGNRQRLIRRISGRNFTTYTTPDCFIHTVTYIHISVFLNKHCK